MKAYISSLLLCLSAHVMASPAQVANLLYSAPEDREFITKFFEVVDLHKTRDPLLEMKGPSIHHFSMDKIKFAFMVNETPTTMDLIIFNWNLGHVDGFSLEQEVSKLYGAPVYRLAAVDKKSIASQGDNHDVLTNFSYLLGSNTMIHQFRSGVPDPNEQIPEWLLNFPHPEYMKTSHPLRKALNLESLVLLAPQKELFFRQLGATPEQFDLFEENLESQGGFIQTVLGMLVHEIYHVEDGNSQILKLAKARSVEPDRDLLQAEIESSSRLRLLLSTYKNIIFSLGENFKKTERLSELSIIISELKLNYPEAWKFVWNYEFSEGFAEYVSAYSMVHVGVTTLEEQIGYQVTDPANNFVYRTGAIGGLYLSEKLKRMPFQNNEDHNMSLWENIISHSDLGQEVISIEQVIKKYEGTESDEEVERVIEYLVSTLVSQE